MRFSIDHGHLFGFYPFATSAHDQLIIAVGAIALVKLVVMGPCAASFALAADGVELGAG